MATNPEFQMRGISFVIAAPGGDRHPLPFKLRLNNGRRIELQRAFEAHYTILDVIAELRLLADTLAEAATAPVGKLDYPSAIAGPTLHSAPVDSKPPQPK